MYIMAIDPGNTYSAYCVMDSETLKPLDFAKVENNALREIMIAQSETYGAVVVERVASYGMAVGREVFETCEWVGRFTEIAQHVNRPAYYVYRMEEKRHICHDSRAKDTNIRQALIDRFARHDLKNGKGTKKDPDWFYGFSADVWSAYSVGLVWAEKESK